jgi:hypothetical protein
MERLKSCSFCFLLKNFRVNKIITKKYFAFLFVSVIFLINGFFISPASAEDEIEDNNNAEATEIVEDILVDTDIPIIMNDNENTDIDINVINPEPTVVEEIINSDENIENVNFIPAKEDNILLNEIITEVDGIISEQDFLNIKVLSNYEIEIIKEILPGVAIISIPEIAVEEQTIMLENLPQKEMYFYIDSLEETLQPSVDDYSKITFVLDGNRPHLIFIKSHHSTKTIRDDDTGGDCASFGIWDKDTLTCTMTEDIFEVIDIVSDGITLDGNGKTIKSDQGFGSGSGVNISFRKNIVAKNLIIEGFDNAFGIFQTSNSSFYNNITRGFGMGFYVAFSSTYTIITGNDISNSKYYLTTAEVSSNGIVMNSNAQRTTVNENTLFVSKFGISFGYSGGNDKVYNNNFLSRFPFPETVGGTRNTLFKPMPIGGNYYRIYNSSEEGCDDINDDYICDVAISFDTQTDKFPWIYKNGWKGERIPDDEKCEMNCFSSVMLIPGFEASRMYNMKDVLGVLVEDKLWEPNLGSDITDLLMDNAGVSIDNNIYTRDIVDTATIYGIGIKNFYKSFMDEMDELVARGEVSSWKAIAYDWRLSPLDIIKRGVENENGDISYNEELTTDQIPYIIDQLQKLADSSHTGKVAVVVHSNGGLVAKSLVLKLEDMKENGESNLIDYIDNIIFVGSPLLGTPEAIPGILHGYSQGMLLNLLLTRKKARDFGQNVPGAYNLLPSEKYFSEINNGLITFDKSLEKLNNWRSLYGESIDSFEEFKKFLPDIGGYRVKPDYDDLNNPLILSESLLNRAEDFHGYLDDLEFPSTIQIHKVAGWGIPTTSNLKYKTKKECEVFLGLLCVKKKLVLSSDLGLTSGGDGTVIAETALNGSGADYYLNLGEYNKDNRKGEIFYSNKSHANIFKVPYLFDLVHNILRNVATLPDYVTTTAPPVVNFTVLKMHSPVAMDIVDEEGYHTGLVEDDDPELEYIENNIPNSSYFEVGDEKYIIVPSDSNYKLVLAGEADGIFTLEQELITNDILIDYVVFRDVPITASFYGETNMTANSPIENIIVYGENEGEFEPSLYPSTEEENVEDEQEQNEPEEHISSSGSVSIFMNRNIPEAKTINTDSVMIALEDKKEDNTIFQVGFSQGKVLSLQVDNNPKIDQPKLGIENTDLSASAGDSGIIKEGILMWVSLIVLVLLIGVRLIFKLK